jgi:hypothetical protein
MKSSPPDAVLSELPRQRDPTSRHTATDDDGKELRAAVQAFVRGLGLLSSDRTPSGGRLDLFLRDRKVERNTDLTQNGLVSKL